MSSSITYDKILAAFDLRKYDIALKMTQEILSEEPNNDYAYCLLAFAYLSKDQYDKGIDVIKKAISLNANEIMYYTVYCNALYCKEEYQEALDVSDDGLMLDPTNTGLMYWRGMALRKLGKLNRAENVTEYLLKKAPNNDDNHRLLADIYNDAEKYNKAEFEYKKALNLNPNNSITHNNFAIMKLNTGDLSKTDEAIEMIKESLRLEPNSEIVQNNLEYAENIKKNTSNNPIISFLTEIASWVVVVYILVKDFIETGDLIKTIFLIIILCIWHIVEYKMSKQENY